MSAHPASLDEPDFLARLRAGPSREVAFEELVRALREQLFAVCLHITGSAADADDALQDAFLSVHLALPAFRAEARLATWVHRIAIRAALRVRARRRPSAEVDAQWPAAPQGDSSDGGELDRRLARALDRLPAEQRVVLSLFAVEGLPHAQIAEILGLPLGTIWSRLHVARKRLAAELGPA